MTERGLVVLDMASDLKYYKFSHERGIFFYNINKQNILYINTL